MRRFGGFLLLWSLLALAASLAILSWETVGPGASQRADLRPSLDFVDLETRFVQSAEGPALEIAGIVRNGGEETVAPAVTLQLAGSRVAIEEHLPLGGSVLPPGAERPFAVRMLIPNGTRTVSLLPPRGADGSREPEMMLVSPGWTAETPGL